MNERPTRGPGRRVGRDRVLAAAVDLLAGADLADLLSFLGTRAVAEAADVQPATVHHHFHNRDESPKPNTRLAAAVLEACLPVDIAEATIRRMSAVSAAERFDLRDIAAISAAAAANLEALLENRIGSMAILVGAAASANDPTARATLADAYDEIARNSGSVLDELARNLGRRFDVESGFDPVSVAIVGRALADGLVLRDQFDPGRITPERFGDLALRLFEAVTTPADADDTDDPVAERLLRRTSMLDLPPDSGLDLRKRSRIVDAVRRLYDTHGAAGLTVTAAAAEADVSRSTVVANFGDRGGLAAVVWARSLPDLERRLETDRERGLPLARLLDRHLHRVVDRCKADPALTSLLLEGLLGATIRTGPPRPDDPRDPRSTVPLPSLLMPMLTAAGTELRAGAADTPEAAADLAATITNLVMVRCISRPDETTSETVQKVLDLVLDGILAPT